MLLIPFEFGMYLFNKRKSFAFICTILLGFSSAVQWWFAINNLVEMLVMGQLALLIAVSYMRTKSYKKRMALVVPLVICMGGYILVFYPSWQVPIGYVFFVFVNWHCNQRVSFKDFFMEKRCSDTSFVCGTFNWFYGKYFY